MTPQVLEKTKDWVLVEKPAGMLSVPGRFADDPRPVLGRWLEEELKLRIWPVHRLDFEVGGLIIYALNKEAHHILNEAFAKRRVQKTYLALSEITPIHPPTTPLERRRKILRGKKRSYESPHGEMAITEIEWAGIDPQVQDCWRWILRPQTGKPHQLRLEMHLLGAPILGDVLYGATKPWSTPGSKLGIALQAAKLEWSPEDQSRLQLPAVSELPIQRKLFTLL